VKVANRAEKRAAAAVARASSRKGDWGVWTSRPEMVPHMRAWGNAIGAYVNLVFAVQLFERHTKQGIVTHLAIRQHNGSAFISWADLQRIKNELAGYARQAVQVFPPEDEVVDKANMTHLFVMPDGGALDLTIQGFWS
jgi:hypothetical protein